MKNQQNPGWTQNFEALVGEELGYEDLHLNPASDLLTEKVIANDPKVVKAIEDFTLARERVWTATANKTFRAQSLMPIKNHLRTTPPDILKAVTFKPHLSPKEAAERNEKVTSLYTSITNLIRILHLIKYIQFQYHNYLFVDLIIHRRNINQVKKTGMSIKRIKHKLAGQAAVDFFALHGNEDGSLFGFENKSDDFIPVAITEHKSVLEALVPKYPIVYFPESVREEMKKISLSKLSPISPSKQLYLSQNDPTLSLLNETVPTRPFTASTSPRVRAEHSIPQLSSPSSHSKFNFMSATSSLGESIRSPTPSLLQGSDIRNQLPLTPTSASKKTKPFRQNGANEQKERTFSEARSERSCL